MKRLVWKALDSSLLSERRCALTRRWEMKVSFSSKDGEGEKLLAMTPPTARGGGSSSRACRGRRR
jgi:hypothetical protein